MHRAHAFLDTTSERTFSTSTSTESQTHPPDWESLSIVQQAAIIGVGCATVLLVLLAAIKSSRMWLVEQCAMRKFKNVAHVQVQQRRLDSNGNEMDEMTMTYIPPAISVTAVSGMSIVEHLAITRMMNRQTSITGGRQPIQPTIFPSITTTYTRPSAPDLPPSYDQVLGSNGSEHQLEQPSTNWDEPDCPPPNYWNVASSNNNDYHTSGYR